jgi:hypothetical protein
MAHGIFAGLLAFFFGQLLHTCVGVYPTLNRLVGIDYVDFN